MMRSVTPPTTSRRDVTTALILTGLAFVVYNLNFRTMATGDSLPARFLPFVILQERTLYLDSIVEVVKQGHPRAYWVLPTRDGRTASMYPVVTPLLVTPLYVPAALYLNLTGSTPRRLAAAGEIMEKVAAAALASVTVGLMYLLLRGRGSPSLALLLAVLFAFGTNTWVTSSQALWQHGAAELCAVLALLAVTRPPERRWVVLAGLAVGLMVANRPFGIFLAAAFSCYAVFFWARRRGILFCAVAATPVLLATFYNWIMFGMLSGGYGLVLKVAAPEGYFDRNPAEGIAGLLVSPGRGLLVYSPFLAVVALFAVRAFKAAETRTLTILLCLGCTALVCFLATADWRAGFSFGPRFLTDIVPVLVWMAMPVVAGFRRLGLSLLMVAGLGSIGVQAFGAFIYNGASEPVINGSWEGPWEWRNAPFVYERRAGLAPRRLLSLAKELVEEEQ